MTQTEDERTIALIICRDDAHAFLLESILDGEADDVIHVQSPRRAIELVMRGMSPSLVLLDVDLFDVPGDTAEAAAALRVIAKDAVVLEVGERLSHSGDQFAARLRGNSVEAREWAELRT